MVETFGEAWQTARVEGAILGKGSTEKIHVKWINIAGEPEIEYGFSHSLFKTGVENGSQIVAKNIATMIENKIHCA
jgi:hypothetical protein